MAQNDKGSSGARSMSRQALAGTRLQTQAVRVAGKDPAAGAFVFHFGVERR